MHHNRLLTSCSLLIFILCFVLGTSGIMVDHPIRHHRLSRRKTYNTFVQEGFLVRELNNETLQPSFDDPQHSLWLHQGSMTATSESPSISMKWTTPYHLLNPNRKEANSQLYTMNNNDRTSFVSIPPKKQGNTMKHPHNEKILYIPEKKNSTWLSENNGKFFGNSQLSSLVTWGLAEYQFNSSQGKDNTGVIIKFSGKNQDEASNSTKNEISIGASAKRKLFYPSTSSRANDSNLFGLSYSPGTVEAGLNNTTMNITSQAGGTAFLPCRVGHLGDTQVSWIRKRDWRVLTSGDDLYTYDERFSVLHETSSHDWTLHVKLVSRLDEGTYECQVSTGTGVISLFVNLRVIVPKAKLSGQNQLHVNRGSSISMTCTIHKVLIPPQHVLWHHNGELLNFLRRRPEINISTEKPVVKYLLIDTIGHNLTTENKILDIRSHLKVSSANDIHSGNYSCSIPHAIQASKRVFITEGGDKIAAVQRIDSGGASMMGMCSNQIFYHISVLVISFELFI